MKKNKTLKLVAALLTMAVCLTNMSITSMAASPEQTFSISQKKITMNEGEYASIDACELEWPAWSSSNVKVAPVDEEGVVYAAKQGSARITAVGDTGTKKADVR